MATPQNNDVVFFGRTDFRNQGRLFGIKRLDRRQHMYIIGKSGTGKSTLINNLIAQDISNGEGLCLVDPHGELVEATLSNIPKSRIDDVVYFNPSDTDFNIGFNILELPDPSFKHLVASGLMGIFTKIWANVWSARMEYILNNTVLALLDTPNSTLLGITRMLVDKKYRQQIIANVQDPVVKAFWVNEYEVWDPKFRNEAIAPIQNKVGQFLSSAVVRNIVGQPKSTIDVFQIMNDGKILLVNLSKGRVGEDNSALLGAMIITKIQLAAMDRVRIPEETRRDFYLYVDEFQNFATDSFASILSEARKYRLNLIVAHQYIGQLVTDTSTRVRDAIFGNVGTMIIFRVGAADAEFLEKEVEPEFVIQDMVGLPNRHIYTKMMCDGITSRPFSAQTLAPFKLKDANMDPMIIIDASRKKYTRQRTEVEKNIEEVSGLNLGGANFDIDAARSFKKPNGSINISPDVLRQSGEQAFKRAAEQPQRTEGYHQQKQNQPRERIAPFSNERRYESTQNSQQLQNAFHQKEVGELSKNNRERILHKNFQQKRFDSESNHQSPRNTSYQKPFNQQQNRPISYPQNQQHAQQRNTQHEIKPQFTQKQRVQNNDSSEPEVTTPQSQKIQKPTMSLSELKNHTPQKTTKNSVGNSEDKNIAIDRLRDAINQSLQNIKKEKSPQSKDTLPINETKDSPENTI